MFVIISYNLHEASETILFRLTLYLSMFVDVALHILVSQIVISIQMNIKSYCPSLAVLTTIIVSE